MSLKTAIQSTLQRLTRVGKKPKESTVDPDFGRICPYCRGTGLRSNNNPITGLTAQPERCSICGGSGRIPV